MIRRRRFWVSTLFASVAFAPLSAAAGQEAVSQRPLINGVVLDEITRAPVSGAVVQIVQGDSVVDYTVTETDGRFRLVKPTARTYRLRLGRIGYRTVEISGQSAVVDASSMLELTIPPGPIVLDSILVPGRARDRVVRRTEQLIHGRLLDDATAEPIANGTVTLVRINPGLQSVGSQIKEQVVSSAISTREGFFRLVTPVPGTYTLRAQRIGYKSGESPKLLMMIGDTVRLDFRLSTQAVLLDPIVVVGSARPWPDRYPLDGMDDFFRRMAQWGGAGHGEFVGREALDRYLQRGFFLSKVIDDVMIRPARGCSGGTLTYLDGGLFGARIDVLSPGDLEAVEIYRAPFLPAELITTLNIGGSGPQRFPCNIVALWTRRQPRR